jgi:hypothetical protein
MKLKALGMEFTFDLNNPAVEFLLVVAIIVLTLTAGVYLTMLALNYVFSLFFAWAWLPVAITITFWQTFWLVLAAFIIKQIIF